MNKPTPYSEFELIPETMVDGWIYGAITQFGTDECSCPPGGCIAGDGFVQSPSGSRIGLVWSVKDFTPFRLSDAEGDFHGVFEVPFAKQIKTTKDIRECIQKLIPFFEGITNRDSAFRSYPRRSEKGTTHLDPHDGK